MSNFIIPKAMRAVRIAKFGGAEVMKIEHNFPVPKILNNQVLVRVCSSGINPVDTYIRSGVYPRLPELPYTPGKDGAGIVVSVGDEVSDFQVGNRVFFSKNSRAGSLADFIALDLDCVFPLHNRLSMAEGASLCIPYFTAYRALLIKGRAGPGKRVLVHGASGAVGQAVVQLGRSTGCVVVGTASTEQGRTIIAENGGIAYDHGKEGYIDEIISKEEKFDIIIEMAAHVNLNSDLKILRPNGCVVIVGCRGDVQISPRLLMGPETSILGCAFAAASKEEKEMTSKSILKSIEDCVVNPKVAKIYPFEEVSQSHLDVVAKSNLGNLVVEISTEN